MKNRLHQFIYALMITTWSFTSAFAQPEGSTKNVRFSVPEIALLDIKPNISSLRFELSPGLSTGDKPTFHQIDKETIWLNYTSAIGKKAVSRSIKAHVTAGSLPKGLEVYIEASNPSFLGSINQGKSTGKVKLSHSPSPIVSDIGNCYTGNGEKKGHEISLSMMITDIEKISQKKQSEFTITYTISDN